MNRLKLNEYERETLLLKLGVPTEDKFCWKFMNDMLIKGKYEDFLKLTIQVLCEIRDYKEKYFEELEMTSKEALEVLEILKSYLKLKVNHRFNTEEIRLDILLKDMTITYNDFEKIKKWLEN